MYSTSIPNLLNQSLIAIEMNSGPLSQRILFGKPCIAKCSANVSIASSLVMLRPDLMLKHSREYSSTMFKNRILRPSTVDDRTKSHVQASCMNRAGTTLQAFFLLPVASFLRRFLGTLQPCSSPKTVHSFVIDACAIPTEQRRDPAITIPWSLANQLKDLLRQPLIFVLWTP